MTNTPRIAIPIIQPTDSMAVSPTAFKNIFTAIDPATGATACTNATKPGSPYDCQLIHVTDLNQFQLWDAAHSAWIPLIETPDGVLALNSAASSVNVTATATKFLSATITSLALLTNRNYKIHCEGTYTFTVANGVSNQNTGTTKVNLHQASGASVTTASPVIGVTYCDEWVETLGVGSNVVGYGMWTFDAVISNATAGTFSFGWSIETSAFFPGLANMVASNTLLYVEAV